MTTVNQIRLIQEKLRYYNKPFIEYSLLEKIVKRFAPGYQIYNLSDRNIVSPIKSWKIYRNNLYTWHVSWYSILWKYMEGKTYMLGGMHIYNRYGYTTQLADRITVYNTSILWKKKIAWAKFIFRKVRKSFFWWKKRKQSQDVYYYAMTPERALIELLRETDGNPEFVDDICYQIETGKVDIKKVKELCNKHCSKRLQHLIQNFLETCSKQ